PATGELHQLGRRGGERRTRHLYPRDVPDDGRLRQHAGRPVAIQREREGAADAAIAERLFLVVDGDQEAAVPRALLHGDFLAERPDDVVSLGRGEATELDVGGAPADSRCARGIVADEEGLVAIEVW